MWLFRSEIHMECRHVWHLIHSPNKQLLNLGSPFSSPSFHCLSLSFSLSLTLGPLRSEIGCLQNEFERRESMPAAATSLHSHHSKSKNHGDVRMKICRMYIFATQGSPQQWLGCRRMDSSILCSIYFHKIRTQRLSRHLLE